MAANGRSNIVDETSTLRKPIDYVTESFTSKASETLLDSIPIYIAVLAWKKGTILFCNAAVRRAFPRKAQRAALQTLLDQYISFKNEKMESFSLEITPDRCLGVSGRRILWEGQEALLVSAQELSSQGSADYLHHVSYIDGLTGLANRYRCGLELEIVLSEAKKSGKTGHVVFLDLDDFKIINEVYGHHYGDALLVEFAQYLSKTKQPGDMVFRFGGDEFIMIITPPNADDLPAIVGQMQERAKTPWQVRDKSFYCTICVGTVSFPDGGMGAREILKNAEVAMHEAKRYGKNSFAVYNTDMGSGSIERAEMERLMREGISAGFKGFSVHYQPMIDLKSERIVGAEALMRWRAGSTSILPESFIPLAEYLGLIVDLGEFILRKSAKLLKKINKHNPDFYLSVNISVRQLQRPSFLEQIEVMVKEIGINPRNLILEITEGLAVTDIQRLQIICAGLHKMGIRVAMDDFGTGYSSLSNMRDVPYDIIKIDRDFIQKAGMDHFAASFIRLITDFGHLVSKAICIEGVETEEQYGYCKDSGADCIQGYYCFYPLPEKDLLQLIFE